MNVRLRILFRPLTENDWQAVRTVARSLTKEPESVRVIADTDPGWLVVEFSIPTQPQYEAVSKIDRVLQHYPNNSCDSMINFSFTEAERARANRKSARQKTIRKAKRATDG